MSEIISTQLLGLIFFLLGISILVFSKSIGRFLFRLQWRSKKYQIGMIGEKIYRAVLIFGGLSILSMSYSIIFGPLVLEDSATVLVGWVLFCVAGGSSLIFFSSQIAKGATQLQLWLEKHLFMNKFFSWGEKFYFTVFKWWSIVCGSVLIFIGLAPLVLGFFAGE